MKPDQTGFSPVQLMKEKFGTPTDKVEREKVAKATKKVKSKKNSKGKYEVKYDVDGIKHLILKSNSY